MHHVSCLVPYSVVATCSSSAGLFKFYSYFTVSVCPPFLAFTASFIQHIFCSGIACLASLAYDWVTACWDSLSILLHSGIVCLAYDWVITNGCFNPFGVSLYYGIAHLF